MTPQTFYLFISQKTKPKAHRAWIHITILSMQEIHTDHGNSQCHINKRNHLLVISSSRHERHAGCMTLKVWAHKIVTLLRRYYFSARTQYMTHI